MPNVTLKITVKTTKKVDAWWAALNEHDLVFQNGEATVSIPDTGEHVFFYWIKGDPGGKITFKIFKGHDERLKGEDVIPPGYFRAGNARIFKIA